MFGKLLSTCEKSSCIGRTIAEVVVPVTELKQNCETEVRNTIGFLAFQTNHSRRLTQSIQRHFLVAMQSQLRLNCEWHNRLQ